MSYAGPVSRGKRAPGQKSTIAFPTAGAAGQSSAAPASSRSASYSSESAGGAIFAAGIALGLVIGAGAALLLAPNSGADTRRAIARRTRRIRRTGRDAWSDLREEFEHALAQRKKARARRQRRELEVE